MAKLPEITKLNEITPAGCILMTYRGSITHGMFVPDSDPNSIDDIDLMGVYIESMDFYTGLNNKSLGFGGRKSDSQEFWIDQYDVVNYELRKLFGLLLKGNPNVLSLLYLNPEHIISKNEIWDDILEVKDLFLSKKAFYSFGGYASEQLRKMTSFKKEEVSDEVYELKAELSLRERKKGGKNFSHIKTRELREKLNTLSNAQGYMGEKRRGLVEKHGYDTKNAAHLIRLLRMGVEYLKHGHLSVDRTNIDAEELLSIKRGYWSLEDVKKEAESWDKELKTQFENSKLPDKPDFDAANMLCSSLIHKYYRSLVKAG